MAGQQRDMEKERYWAKVIRDAARSGTSIREFCAKHKVKESQFYWWQRKLRERREDRILRRGGGKMAPRPAGTFALVSEQTAVGPGAAAPPDSEFVISSF